MSNFCPEIANKNAYQYYLSVKDTFNTICAPLFNLGVKNFNYLKVHDDGTYLHLSNNPGFIEASFKTVKNLNGDSAREILEKIRPNKKNYFYPAYGDIGRFNKGRNPFISLYYDFDIWNVFCIVHSSQPGSIEWYEFGMSRNESDILSFYLNNLGLLEHFIKYFNEKAHHLINIQDKCQLALFDQNFIFGQSSQSEIFEQKAVQFLQSTKLKGRITSTNCQISLTKREGECIYYLAQCKTIKEIGRILDLSPRTVEFYINKVKKKTGYTKKSDLVSHFIQ